MQLVAPVARFFVPRAISWKASCAVVTGMRKLWPARNTPADWLSRTSIFSERLDIEGCRDVGEFPRMLMWLMVVSLKSLSDSSLGAKSSKFLHETMLFHRRCLFAEEKAT